ncbi:GroES-like protein [Podospora australis]|uniref:GroES-like protein n=1 Tax=Podospora australis TaxID=1536484 RepID=A0AAN6WHP9_9PEZI|nr:GroES-like protein [Podospora australis]
MVVPVMPPVGSGWPSWLPGPDILFLGIPLGQCWLRCELVLHGVPAYTGQRRKVDIPKPGPDEVLIRVVATGLAPKDWKFTKNSGRDRALNAGDDIAGIVESVGSSVFEYKPGDRLPLFTAWVTHQAHMLTAIALYQALQLPLPTVPGSKDTSVLIYGGATAVGAYALQSAKLSGLGPIVTVAGSGIDYVKSLDVADHIIDYRQGNVTQTVLSALNSRNVHRALDAVSSKGSHQVIVDILTASGGENVKFSLTFVASAYSQKHAYITQKQADADGEFAFFFYRYLSYLLAQGRSKPHPHEVLPDGLDGIVSGVQRLYDGKVLAKKLVSRNSETPELKLRSQLERGKPTLP